MVLFKITHQRGLGIILGISLDIIFKLDVPTRLLQSDQGVSGILLLVRRLKSDSYDSFEVF